jgi:PilZ domain
LPDSISQVTWRLTADDSNLLPGIQKVKKEKKLENHLEFESELVNRRPFVNTTDRRRAERILIPFPAVVEGVDHSGAGFKVNTVLDNLSKGGLYLRMIPSVDVGTKLNVIFRLSASVETEASSTKIEIKGEVMRVDRKEGGACGVALKYSPSRFI